jgi:hypothetical protein
MYILTWNKYLPVIKILLKRAIAEEQSLALNSTDFQKTAVVKKTGFSFSIKFSHGRATNLIGAPLPAKDLASVLMEDTTVKELFTKKDFHINMDAKFRLGIKYIPESV